MYTKDQYLGIRSKLSSTVERLLTLNKDLYKRLANLDKDNLVELAMFWGESEDRGGCYRFHLMLNLKKGLSGKFVYLYVTHVPQTDSGYEWEGEEIHVHPKKPFFEQPLLSHSFLDFMVGISKKYELEKLLNDIVESEGLYEPPFVKRLEAIKAS
ncbi:MAG: hypothetical protein QG551_117 [Patescibacteria group bacterium]|jgi:hypothetical protein|nr:hypothetical protein [Patescibacteria group bacterium]